MLCIPLSVSAHAGRTNAEGCHTNTATGEYHCHTKVAKTEAKTMARTEARTTSFVDKNCSDFTTQKAAQEFYISAGGPNKDPHRLDSDKDGKACEDLG